MAAPSVATITSAVPFTLDGHSVSTPGVTSFPVVVGDTVATSNGVAVLLFQDGSKVKLGPNSSVKVSGMGSKPKVVLLGGTLDFKLIPGSNVSVVNLDAERKQTSATVVNVNKVKTAPVVASNDSVATVAPTAAAVSTTTAAAGDPTTAPVAIATSSMDVSASLPAQSGSKLTSPEFLVPAVGAGSAGLATALFLTHSGSAATTPAATSTSAPTSLALAASDHH